jgi:hypothetical protein
MRMLLALVVLTACGEDEIVSRDARTPDVEIKPKPKPVDLTLSSLGAGLEMRHPIRDGNLTIIPIVTTRPVPMEHYVTLSDGLANHTVTVRERGRGSSFAVDQVNIRNKGSLPLFVMTGELIFDGLQDREIAESRVLAPGTRASVQVRCVEQGREAGHLEFHASGLLAELRVRKATIFQTQQEVWAEVEKLNAEHHLTPPTKTYRGVAELQNATDAATRRDAIARQLAALPDRAHLVGLVAVSGTQIVDLERFTTPELYGQYEQELLGSYIASDDGPPHEGRSLLPADVRTFVDNGKHRDCDAAVNIVVGP